MVTKPPETINPETISPETINPETMAPPETLSGGVTQKTPRPLGGQNAASALAAQKLPETVLETFTPPPAGGSQRSASGARGGLEGDSIGPYQLLKKIGEGGMGVVWQAEHSKLKKTVALKMIRSYGNAGPEELERFEIEAQAMARLKHPNIVPIYDIQADDELVYMAMEFIEGGTLSETIRKHKQLPIRQAVALTELMARALHHAHSRGIVHRDMKPANVLMRDEAPVITDFGLAKAMDQSHTGLTKTGDVLGTPAYMPPEQIEGRLVAIDGRADVYALGATLFEMVAGGPPFEGSSALVIVNKVMTQPPPDIRQLCPEADRELWTLIERCLVKEPERRYESAEALADDCRRYLDGTKLHAKPICVTERLLVYLQNHMKWLVGLSVLAILLLLFDVWYVTDRWATESLLRNEAQLQQQRAEQQVIELKAAAFFELGKRHREQRQWVRAAAYFLEAQALIYEREAQSKAKPSRPEAEAFGQELRGALDQVLVKELGQDALDVSSAEAARAVQRSLGFQLNGFALQPCERR